MNLEALIGQFRVDADDVVGPAPAYLWKDEWIAGWLSEAQEEAAIRGRLLYEAADPLVCEIAIVAGTASYALHPALYEIECLRFKPASGERSRALRLVSREDMDDLRHDWRDRTDGRVEFAIQDDTRIQLASAPQAAGVLHIEGYRLPLLVLKNDTDTPEINCAHHRHLVQWALHRAFSRPDAETIDPNRAALAEAEFTRYFGLRPDADLRRTSRHDTPHHNRVDWA